MVASVFLGFGYITYYITNIKSIIKDRAHCFSGIPAERECGT